MRDLFDYYSEGNAILIYKPFFERFMQDNMLDNTNIEIDILEEKPFSTLSNKKSQTYNILIDNIDAQVFRIIYSRKGNQSNNPLAWFFISRFINGNIIVILLNPFEVHQNRHSKSYYKKIIELQIAPYKTEINTLFSEIEQGIINLNDSNAFYIVASTQDLDKQEEKPFCNTSETHHLNQLSSEINDTVDNKRVLELIYHLLMSIDLDQGINMRTEGYHALAQYLSLNMHKTLALSKVNNDRKTIMIKIGEGHQSKFISLNNRTLSSDQFFDEISEIDFQGKDILWKTNFQWGNNIDHLLNLLEWNFYIESNTFSAILDHCKSQFISYPIKLKLFLEKISLQSIKLAGLRSLRIIIDILIEDLQSFLSFLEHEEVLENLSIIFNYGLTKNQEKIIFIQHFSENREEKYEEENQETISSFTAPTITRFFESCLKTVQISEEFFTFNASFFTRILHWLEKNPELLTNILSDEISRILKECDEQTESFILSELKKPFLFREEKSKNEQCDLRTESIKNPDKQKPENISQKKSNKKKEKRKKKNKKFKRI